MITLIGHGYVGEHIAQELVNQGVAHHWIRHNDPIAEDTTVVINAAGYTGLPNVDACEIFKDETINGNVAWALELERRCPNIPIVHISSGCVYTGYVDGGWTEEDQPNFTFSNGSFYSGSKALEERMLKSYMNKSYLLRIRMPFGDKEHPRNLLTKLKRYQKLINFENSLSYINDVAQVAVKFAIDRPATGVYNVCNPGSKTTEQITDMMGLDKEWFTLEEFLSNTKAPRSNCVLNTDKLSKVYTMLPIDQALATAIERMNG